MKLLNCLLLTTAVATAALPAAAQGPAPVAVTQAPQVDPAARDQVEVLTYPTKDDGSIMNWLCISPLPYDASYLGDSMSYDVFKVAGQNELTERPSQGDVVSGQSWHRMAFPGTNEGPSMCELFNVAGIGMWNYGVTVCYVYLYSPVDHPNATFAGSSDDGLKVVLNGKKVWTNQIQRSPTYDSDRFAAPLHQGWNTVLCFVDQVIGGHLLCARFLDNGKPITDLQISLDPPTAKAKRSPASTYNAAAADLIRSADAVHEAGKLADAETAYAKVATAYPLADVAPRALYSRAQVLYALDGTPSLNQPAQAVTALQALLDSYPHDVLGEYALLDMGTLQETALKDETAAAATYRAFEVHFPHSSLAAKSQVKLAHLLNSEKHYEDAMLTYRRVIKEYPDSDEVMTATVGIGDTYKLQGENAKAHDQYLAAQAMATDWHDNKYGIDVGKQAWLQGLLDYLRVQLA